MSPEISEARNRHWAKTRGLSNFILVLWFIFAFLMPWFAKELNAFEFMGFKLGYYMVVQGSLIAFVAMIWYQNWRQDAIDKEFGVSDE